MGTSDGGSREGSSIAAITNLLYEYAHALDGGDRDRFTACFTATASFWPNRGPFQPDKGAFVGHKAIGGFVSDTNVGRPRHIVLNPVVNELRGDTAECSALFALFDLERGVITALGTYADTAVCDESGDWRFTDKQIHFLWQSDDYRVRAAESIPRAPSDP